MCVFVPTVQLQPFCIPLKKGPRNPGQGSVKVFTPPLYRPLKEVPRGKLRTNRDETTPKLTISTPVCDPVSVTVRPLKKGPHNPGRNHSHTDDLPPVGAP